MVYVHDNVKILSKTIDISEYGLLFGLFLLYADRVPFELLDSAALLYEGRAAVEGGKKYS
jgi:hypothetical protein